MFPPYHHVPVFVDTTGPHVHQNIASTCRYEITCDEQPVVSFEEFELSSQLAANIFEPVAFINNDVCPLHLAQAWTILSAHDQLICSEQHMEPRCLSMDLRPTSLTAKNPFERRVQLSKDISARECPGSSSTFRYHEGVWTSLARALSRVCASPLCEYTRTEGAHFLNSFSQLLIKDDGMISKNGPGSALSPSR
jgi:hypothetical protein